MVTQGNQVVVRLDSASSRLAVLLSRVKVVVLWWIDLDPMSQGWLNSIRNRERAS